MKRRLLYTLSGSITLLAGCFSPSESVLFSDRAAANNVQTGGTGQAGGPAGGAASGARAGTDAGSGANGGTQPMAGAVQGGGGAMAAVGGHGGEAGTPPMQAPVITDCSMVEGASVDPLSGHCYRVEATELLTFDAAAERCMAAGGHLVTIGSAEENAYVAEIHDGEHWLGATDQKASTEAGAGVYSWLNQEPWGFSLWEDGQPNAFAVDCPGDGDADCYEHCAFQEDDGEWNDRSCWHTLVSICEWDVDTAGVAPVDGASPPG